MGTKTYTLVCVEHGKTGAAMGAWMRDTGTVKAFCGCVFGYTAQHGKRVFKQRPVFKQVLVKRTLHRLEASMRMLDNNKVNDPVNHPASEVQPSKPWPRPEQTSDPVNHPSHYTHGKFEVFDVLQDWFADQPLLWQVVKYLSRAKHKGNYLQDLKKAQWYLNKAIVQEETRVAETTH